MAPSMKLLLSLVALASHTQAAILCGSAPNPAPKPRTKCGMQGVLLNPGNPLTPDASITPAADDFGNTPVDHCYSSCWRTASCVSFAVDEQAGTCTLYDKKIISMKARKRTTSNVYFYNQKCFQPTETANGLFDPSFENAAESQWIGNGGEVTVATDDVYDGTQALLFTVNQNSNEAELENRDYAMLCEGTNYKLSVAYKLVDLGGCSAPQIQMQLKRRISSASWVDAIAAHDLTSADADQWNILELQNGNGDSYFTSSWMPYYLDIYLGQRNFGECQGLSVLLDDIKITAVPSEL